MQVHCVVVDMSPVSLIQVESLLWADFFCVLELPRQSFQLWVVCQTDPFREI